MILYPLQVDSDGGLYTSNNPIDVVSSEVQSLLDTPLRTRPLRMSYGTETYVLAALNLGQLLADLRLKLSQSLESFGFSNIRIGSTSTSAELAQGVVKIEIRFDSGGQTEELLYSTTVENLRFFNDNN